MRVGVVEVRPDEGAAGAVVTVVALLFYPVFCDVGVGSCPRRVAACFAYAFGESSVAAQRQSAVKRSRGDLYAIYVEVICNDTLRGIAYVKRFPGQNEVIRIVDRYSSRKCRIGRRGTSVNTEISQHAGVAGNGVARQAQLAVEYRQGIVAAIYVDRIDHDIVSLARSHENFTLHAGYTRQRVAVFSNQ